MAAVIQKPSSVGIVSLGCSKNLVDSESMLGGLDPARFSVVPDPHDADVVIVNTCGFIAAAREESVDAILEAAHLKEQGRARRVVVTGCMVQRYAEELQREIPEVDAFVGFSEYGRLGEILDSLTPDRVALEVGPVEVPFRDEGQRVRLTPTHTAYLRIAEGCDHTCTFCAIPLMRGLFRSKPLHQVVLEARTLARSGVREINLIAQDITDYGKDRPGESLPALLRALNEVPGIRWIRLLYAYPKQVDDELIETIAATPKVVNYIDIPLQHASDRMLRRMGRQVTRATTEELLSRLRSGISDVVLRTTFIVGFPGETEADFEELLEFVSTWRFDRLGAFTYSLETDTPAFRLAEGSRLPEAIKEERFHRLMELQRELAFEKQEEWVGREVEVLVDEVPGPGVAVGRTYGDAPEIDGTVQLTTTAEDPLYPGWLGPVRIDAADGYDLVGRPAGR